MINVATRGQYQGPVGQMALSKLNRTSGVHRGSISGGSPIAGWLGNVLHGANPNSGVHVHPKAELKRQQRYLSWDGHANRFVTLASDMS